MVDLIASVLVIAGAALALLAAVGLRRFPDVLSRMHAATKPATLGMLLVLVAVGLRDGRVGVIAKVALVAALQFLTAPTGAHMVGRAVYRDPTGGNGHRGACAATAAAEPPEAEGLTAPE